MITSNRRIFLAIFLSLVIFFGIKYISSNPSLFRPDNIYASIIQKTEELKVKISSIRLPDFSKIFTLNFNPDSNVAMKQYNNNTNSFSLPAVGRPTSNQVPTGTWRPIPTNKPIISSRLQPTARPTTKLNPTDIPQPTVPTLQPITSDTRPGTNLKEIFHEVSIRYCFPEALLRAFQEAESGVWIKYDDSPSKIAKYNSYGWWKNPAIDPCFAFGYDLKTGIVPSDSTSSIKNCQIVVPQANPGTMSLFMTDQIEQDGAWKYIKNILPNNIDRRVFFDTALIMAVITKNRVVEPEDCNADWPDDTVRLAAQKHLGACMTASGYSYCDQVLSLYKKYR